MATNRQRTKKKNAGKRRPRHLNLTKFFSIMASVVSLIGMTGFLLWYFSFETIRVEDIISVSYTGCDTQGTAILSIASAEATTDTDTAADTSAGTGASVNGATYAPSVRAFLEDTELLLSENGHLSNGDILDIQLLYDAAFAKAAHVRVESATCQLEVQGLPEGKELSPQKLFEGLNVSYEGTAPALTVTIQNSSDDPFCQLIRYELTEPKEYYDVGDTLTIKASLPREEAILHEYILPAPTGSGADPEADAEIYSDTSEYRIEAADRYIRSTAELSDEHLAALDQAARTLFGAADEYGLRIFSEANLMPIWVNGKTTFVWSNPRLISAYLNCLKPEYFQSTQHHNDVKLVYLATLSQADGVACDAEVVVQFHDLLQKADGSYDLSLDSGQIIAASFQDAHIKDLVNDTYNKEYESEKLDLE